MHIFNCIKNKINRNITLYIYYIIYYLFNCTRKQSKDTIDYKSITESVCDLLNADLNTYKIISKDYLLSYQRTYL